MKISIITVTFNNAAVLDDCIKSVLNQSHNSIEHIVIDGGSKDNTINILKKYQNHLSKFISEPDQGIYHAMNKGINLADGDVRKVTLEQTVDLANAQRALIGRLRRL